MDLGNHTRFPAHLFRAGIDERRLAASVAVRVTYDLSGGRLNPSDEQPWTFSPGPWKGPYGDMDGDEVFYRGGVDVFLFGKAHAPGGRSVPYHMVTLVAGSLQRRVVVFGDRVWEKRSGRGRPQISPPKPYAVMPLDLSRAFGGKDTWDGLEVPFPDNPDGKGFVSEESRVNGTALPNLEDPDQLIKAWEDRPEPAGLGCCAMTNGLRLRNSVAFDDQGSLVELKPTFFNAAFPRMIAPRLSAGEWVQLDGIRPEGLVQFPLPDHRFAVRLAFGNGRAECPLAIDQLGIEGDNGRVFITYRYPFRYVLNPMQIRTCELIETAGVAR